MEAAAANHRHPLVLRRKAKSYTCDRCKCNGVGRKYRCKECKIDLHEVCATCPEIMEFFMHSSDHALKLERSWNPLSHCHCAVCGEKTHGYHYRCKPCGFDVHPICSLLKPTAAAETHPGHTLTYTNCSTIVPCAVCAAECDGWRYCCDQCSVHLHMKCLHASESSSDGKEASIADGRGGGGRDKMKTAIEVCAVGFVVVLGVVLASLGEDIGDLDDDDDDDSSDDEDEDDDEEEEEEEEKEEESKSKEEKKKKKGESFLKKLLKKEKEKKKGDKVEEEKKEDNT